MKIPVLNMAMKNLVVNVYHHLITQQKRVDHPVITVLIYIQLVQLMNIFTVNQLLIQLLQQIFQIKLLIKIFLKFWIENCHYDQ